MIQFKHGVKTDRWVPEIWYAIVAAEAIFTEYGQHLIITSGQDGNHQRASAHYTGRAFDCRIRNFSGYPDLGINAPEIQSLFSDLSSGLGPYYDVVLESDHIHVEFDPKTGVAGDWYYRPELLEWVS